MLYRLPASGKISELFFQGFDLHKAPKLQIATSTTGSLLELTASCWKQTARPNTKHVKIQTTLQLNFPTLLKDTYVEQLMKVYTNLVHPTQFPPQLFTAANANDILACGLHVSEQTKDIRFYYRFGDKSVLQHCRHYNSMYLYSLCVSTASNSSSPPVTLIPTASDTHPYRQRHSSPPPATLIPTASDTYPYRQRHSSLSPATTFCCRFYWNIRSKNIKSNQHLFLASTNYKR